MYIYPLFQIPKKEWPWNGYGYGIQAVLDLNCNSWNTISKKKKKSDSLNWKIKSCALSLVVVLVVDKGYRHLNISSRLQTFPQKSSWLLKKLFHKSLLDYYREEKSRRNFQVLCYWIVHYDFQPFPQKYLFQVIK